MRAAYIDAPGSPVSITYGDLPTPEPGPHDVLVRAIAMALNPVDTYIITGQYHTNVPRPYIIGRDLAGTVVATGERVTRFHTGDRVWTNSLGYDGRQGAFAEYACVDESRVYPLPDGVDPARIVAVLHYAGTAYTGLVHHARLRPGETIFVNGGAGNTGSAVLQMGVYLGARVIATVRSEDDAVWCRRWGADQVIDSTTQEVADTLREAAPNGVDIHWDTTGHLDLEAAVEALAPRGRIVVMAGMRQRPTLPVGPFYLKDGSIVGFVISNATIAELNDAAMVINRMLAAGRLEACIAAELPLADAAKAYALIAGSPDHPPAKGRVVVYP